MSHDTINKIYNISSNLVVAVHQALLFIIIGNFWGSELMGKFTYLVSAGYMLSFLFNYGYQINSLVYLQKKYYRLMQKYISISFLFLCLFLVIVVALKIDMVYAAVLFYVAFLVFKDIVNNLYATLQEYKKKFIFNIVDMLMVIFVLFSISFFVKDFNMILFIIFFSLTIQKFVLYSLIKDIRIITPKIRYMSINSVKFTYKTTFFNNINTMFTFFYLQGYYVVLGFLGKFELIALIKAISVFQSFASIIVGALLQFNMKGLVKNVSNRPFIKKVIFELSLVEIFVITSSFLLIVNTDILYVLFKIKIDSNLFIFFLLLSFLFVPLKMVYANILTIKNLHKERLNSTVFSALFSLPLLFATYYSKWYLVLYIVLLDLTMIGYFRHYIKRGVKI
jgi:O-antigen/teichoic acid export membrane protein